MAKGRNGKSISKGVKIAFIGTNLIVLLLDVILFAKLYKSDDKDVLDNQLETTYVSSVETTTAEATEPITETTTQEMTTKPQETTGSGSFDGPRIIIDIEYFNQNSFPTFCEGVTTLMALRYMGYEVTIDDLIEKYIPSFELKRVNGTLVGEDPNMFFIGNPRANDAKGCYAPVIARALESIAGSGASYNLTGMDIEDLLTQYVNKGFPVIFWATMDMKQSQTGDTWLIERTGAYFTWKAREHCLLLSGSDKDKYYFYDPLDNHGIIAYDKKLVEERYNQLGKMAVALIKRADEN